MRFLRILVLLSLLSSYAQQGGMYLPSLLKGSIEDQMQAIGSRLSAEDIYSLNNNSLKDAIGHFNGGCTSSVISPNGLLLTNHHCGYSQIQSHSSIENDYLKNGFWAQSFEDELPNEDLYVDFIVSIHDVTDLIESQLATTGADRNSQSAINSASDKIANEWSREDWQQTKVKSFYEGNAFYLFVYERFEDIRLVGAPPSSIGKFGNDTDNWVYPRHAGDFSLFRIYADKNNRPSSYSPENTPYKPKHYLPISLDGVSEDDFTMVLGFPGTTSEYLPAVAIEQIAHLINPATIEVRNASLSVIDKFMMANDTIRIQYASKQARIANSWKRWIGEIQGIDGVGVIEIKKNQEAEFSERLKNAGLEMKYGSLLTDLEKAYTDYAPINLKRRLFLEVFTYNNELMKMMLDLNGIVRASERSEQAFDYARNRFLSRYSDILKDFNPTVDKAVYEVVAPFYFDQVDTSIYETTNFTNLDRGRTALTGTMEEVIENINSDSAYALAEPYLEDYFKNVYPQFQNMNSKIGDLQQKYMAALMEVFNERQFYPDANSTLRVSFGKVKGYQPRDAVYYSPVSHLEGVIEKYIPGDYEFDVDPKLIELYEAKEYGQYQTEDGQLPVCFVGTNHTTGGNSGSPVVDGKGNLIGLNFDRVWEGTMSDYYFDPSICRNIMVDARYILFVIDKFAGADRLIKELKLVHPKG